MRIKGIALLSIISFVKIKFPDKYDLWYKELPEQTKQLIRQDIKRNEWYPIDTCLIIPTRLLCDLFYHGDTKGAWEAGRFSAEEGLTGIYSLFFKIGSPTFIINKASVFLSSYYENSTISSTITDDNNLTLTITNFERIDEVIEMRIAGWVEKAAEFTGAHNIKVKLTKQLSKNDPVTELKISWVL